MRIIGVLNSKGWIGRSLHGLAMGRKVRAEQGTVVANDHRGQPQGQCHRKYTADGRQAQVRLKWCGKSAPRCW